MSTATVALQRRKTPVQARSSATVAALHTATIQVLTREGLSRCTTTRVAGRAGISVGSLYQYYPNRDSLLAAVLAEHLEGVAATVEQACHAATGRPVREMATSLVLAYLQAKLSDPAQSKALYAVADQRGGSELVRRLQARLIGGIADMLDTATDADFDDPVATATVAFNCLAGPVTALLKGFTPPGFEARLEPELVRLLRAYLSFSADPAGNALSSARIKQSVT